MAKAYVLLSGGIDSTTCLYMAHQEYNGDVAAVSVDYGQRHVRETLCAHDICEDLGVDHVTIPLATPMQTMLTDASIKVPDIKYDDIKGVSPTYVPFRNGQLISILTAYAVQDKDAQALYFGAHAEDAANWAYPDCTPEFIGAMQNAVYIGTYQQLRLVAPFTNSTKAEIVRKGTSLGVPYGKTWSCYKGEELHCGECPTCYARWEAFVQAAVTDPTQYANTSKLSSF